MIGRLKGGAGSGFYGHAGRPGLEGGSVARGILTSNNNLKSIILPKNVSIVDVASYDSTNSPTAYYILPDDRVIYCKFGHTNAAIDIAKVNPDKYSQERFRADYVSNLLKSGYIRIMQAKKTTAIETNTIDIKQLRKLQNLVNSNKLELASEVVWSGDSNVDATIRTQVINSTDFMMSRYVTIQHEDENSDIIILKGGLGSGFHGHKGRPGFVGGSSTEGSSASNIRFTEQGNRVSKVEGVSDSIDTGIAYIVDDLHKMGYKTIQCCSGLNIDHPKDVHPGSGYIAFINSNNTPEQLQNIRNAANAVGMHIQTDDVFFSPATTVRMPQTVDMSFHSDLVKAANIEADKLVYDNNHEDTRTFLDKWLPVREEILDRLVNEHGGYIEDDSVLNDIWQSFITNLRDITSRNKEFPRLVGKLTR